MNSSGGGRGFSLNAGTARAADPAVKAALSSPKLVRLDVLGAITMYEAPPEEVLPVARQPVPVNGQNYDILPETVTDAAEAQRLTAAAAEADIKITEEAEQEKEAARVEAGLPAESVPLEDPGEPSETPAANAGGTEPTMDEKPAVAPTTIAPTSPAGDAP